MRLFAASPRKPDDEVTPAPEFPLRSAESKSPRHKGRNGGHQQQEPARLSPSTRSLSFIRRPQSLSPRRKNSSRARTRSPTAATASKGPRLVQTSTESIRKSGGRRRRSQTKTSLQQRDRREPLLVDTRFHNDDDHDDDGPTYEPPSMNGCQDSDDGAEDHYDRYEEDDQIYEDDGHDEADVTTRTSNIPRPRKAKKGNVVPTVDATQSVDNSVRDDDTSVQSSIVHGRNQTKTKSSHLTEPRTSKFSKLRNKLEKPRRATYYADDTTFTSAGTSTIHASTVVDSNTYLSNETGTMSGTIDTVTTRDEETGERQRKMFSDDDEDTYTTGQYRLATMSGDEVTELMSASEDGIFLVKQRVAYMCIILSSIQLGILIIQLTLCGLASLKINPLLGPYPDAFSEWGGKNTYLLVEGQQYFRLITPALLHVGFLHFIVNAYCQLETCAYLEREWGSSQWTMIYIFSSIGSCLTASTVDPDTIGVLSSGALMGLFGAKIAHTITWSLFELKSSILEDSVHFEHLGGVMCSAATVSLLSFFTYIDWSGHLGGLASGFLGGMIVFSWAMKSKISRFIWVTLALAGIVAGAGLLGWILFTETAADEELGDACQYFRNLYPEGYECECVWG